jgi:hypothetical protein
MNQPEAISAHAINGNLNNRRGAYSCLPCNWALVCWIAPANKKIDTQTGRTTSHLPISGSNPREGASNAKPDGNKRELKNHNNK